jgi:hypothetical protein
MRDFRTFVMLQGRRVDLVAKFRGLLSAPLVRKAVTVSVEHSSFKTKLRAITVIMGTIETVILAVTLHDGSDCKEFGLAALGRNHFFALCVDHWLFYVSRVHLPCELVGFLKCAIYQVSRVIIRIIIVREE